MGRDWPTEFRMWYVIWHGVMNFWSNICNISHIHSKRHIKTMTMTNMYVANFFFSHKSQICNHRKKSYIQWQSIVPLCFSQGNNYVDLSKNILYLKTRTVSVIKTAQKSPLKILSLMLDFLCNYWNREVEFFFHTEKNWTK